MQDSTLDVTAERNGAERMMVTVMEMMMMILMKPSSMTVTVAMISPLREGISPADFSLPESFSLSIVFCPAEAAENSLDGSAVLRVPRGRSTSKGSARGGPGPPHHPQARPEVGPRLGMVRAHGGPPPAPLLASSVLGEIGTSRLFPGRSDLREYGILTLRFPAEF